MRTFAVLPVKSFARAKQRIRGLVAEPALREALAEAMVADVLATLAGVEAIDRVLVVTAEPRAVVLARGCGAQVVDDAAEAGQSAAARLGVRVAVAEGAQRVLLVPGDTPSLQAAEIVALLAGHEDGAPAATIVPDRHGSGTNALLLSPPHALQPAFGPGSLARHARLGQAERARVRIREVAGLALDVDTPDDLATLEARLDAGDASLAPLTRAALGPLARVV